MVRSRNWRALIQYGVIFFLLEKLGAVVGVSIFLSAAMRGRALEDFRDANARSSTPWPELKK
jgi:gallate dioxygenase